MLNIIRLNSCVRSIGISACGKSAPVLNPLTKNIKGHESGSSGTGYIIGSIFVSSNLPATALDWPAYMVFDTDKYNEDCSMEIIGVYKPHDPAKWVINPTYYSIYIPSTCDNNANVYKWKYNIKPVVFNVQGQEERKPNLNQKAGSINYLNPERLEERIDGTEFNVNDLIHAIINSQPFAQRVDVPDDQIRLVLFYAFLGKKMITMDVEKEIMRHNIYYNYMKTGRYLREMAEQGLIKMEERIAKKSKNKYYLWKFSDQDDYNRFRSAKPQLVV